MCYYPKNCCLEMNYSRGKIFIFPFVRDAWPAHTVGVTHRRDEGMILQELSELNRILLTL